MTCENCGYLNNEVWPILFENEHWRIVLFGESQEYLGKAVVTAKEHVCRLSELNTPQWEALHEAIAWFEERVNDAFKPDHYNWACLMNNAAGRGEETHVHWHVTPRYSRTIELFGETFIDQRFGMSSREVAPKHLSQTTLSQVAERVVSSYARL